MTATDPLDVEALHAVRIANGIPWCVVCDRQVGAAHYEQAKVALAAAHAEKEAMGENLRIALERMIAAVAERDAITEKIAVAIERKHRHDASWDDNRELTRGRLLGLTDAAAIARKVGGSDD